MTPAEFNQHLTAFNKIMQFPTYMKRINKATYDINENIIDDYLFMYGKINPVINAKKLYSYIKDSKNSIFSASISRLLRKYKCYEEEDFIIKDNEYLLSPEIYYVFIFNELDIDIQNKFNNTFVYAYMYDEYLKLKNQ